MLDLPACVVPVTTVDPAKDGKATNVEYFSDTDKLIHDQCKHLEQLPGHEGLDRLTHVCAWQMIRSSELACR